jgi:hypothetical protein
MERFLGVDGAAREEEVACCALADEQRQPPDVAGAQVDAETSAGDAHARAHRGDADVARDRELHARADGRAVDRRDNGSGMGDDGVEHPLERGTERVDGRGLVVGETRHEVRARAERGTGAGDHDRA